MIPFCKEDRFKTIYIDNTKTIGSVKLKKLVGKEIANIQLIDIIQALPIKTKLYMRTSQTNDDKGHIITDFITNISFSNYGEAVTEIYKIDKYTAYGYIHLADTYTKGYNYVKYYGGLITTNFIGNTGWGTGGASNGWYGYPTFRIETDGILRIYGNFSSNSKTISNLTSRVAFNLSEIRAPRENMIFMCPCLKTGSTKYEYVDVTINTNGDIIIDKDKRVLLDTDKVTKIYLDGISFPINQI